MGAAQGTCDTLLAEARPIAGCCSHDLLRSLVTELL